MKTFTALKLAIAAVGMASLACGTMNGQVSAKTDETQLFSEVTSVLGKKFLSSLPPNLSEEIPKEILPIFKKENLTNIGKSKENATIFLQKATTPLRNHKVSVKVSVFDEAGKRIENASVCLLQIRGLSRSISLEDPEISANSVQYEVRKKTDLDGNCLFTGIEGLNALSLASSIRFGNLPKNNLRLTINSEWHSTVKKEFVNADKKTLAFATCILAALMNSWEFYSNGRQYPKLAEKVTIPQENLGDIIEIKVVLKKAEAKPVRSAAGNKDADAIAKPQPSSAKK
jgi:hypothetical protein